MGRNRNRNNGNNEHRDSVETMRRIIRENKSHRRMLSLLTNRECIYDVFADVPGRASSIDEILDTANVIDGDSDLTLISNYMLKVLGSLRNYHNDKADYEGIINSFIDRIRNDKSIYDISDYIIDCILNIAPETDRSVASDFSYAVMLYHYASSILEKEFGADVAASSTTEDPEIVEPDTEKSDEAIAMSEKLAHRIVELMLDQEDIKEDFDSLVNAAQGTGIKQSDFISAVEVAVASGIMSSVSADIMSEIDIDHISSMEDLEKILGKKIADVCVDEAYYTKMFESLFDHIGKCGYTENQVDKLIENLDKMIGDDLGGDDVKKTIESLRKDSKKLQAPAVIVVQETSEPKKPSEPKNEESNKTESVSKPVSTTPVEPVPQDPAGMVLYNIRKTCRAIANCI